MPACPTVCAGTRVRSKAFSFGSGRRLPRGSRAAEGAVARKPVRRRETAVQRGSVPRRKQEGRRVSFVTRRPVCVRLRAPLKRATYPSEWKEAGGGQKGEPPPSGVRRCRPGARKALDGGGTARPQWPQKKPCRWESASKEEQRHYRLLFRSPPSPLLGNGIALFGYCLLKTSVVGLSTGGAGCV